MSDRIVLAQKLTDMEYLAAQIARIAEATSDWEVFNFCCQVKQKSIRLALQLENNAQGAAALEK